MMDAALPSSRSRPESLSDYGSDDDSAQQPQSPQQRPPRRAAATAAAHASPKSPHQQHQQQQQDGQKHTPPPLRPQRSTRSLILQGTRSPPSSMTPRHGRSPRAENVDLPPLPASASAAVFASTSASEQSLPSSSMGLGILNHASSPALVDDLPQSSPHLPKSTHEQQYHPDESPSAALIAQAEAEASAQAEAESRPRTLSGVRALAKERARQRKEAALAALNASSGLSTAEPPSENTSTDDEPLARQESLRNRRRQASRQDTVVRDVLQASIETGVAPPIDSQHDVPARTTAHAPSTETERQRARTTSTAAVNAAAAGAAVEDRQLPTASDASAHVAGEFAELDAALSAALHDLDLGTNNTSAATIQPPKSGSALDSDAAATAQQHSVTAEFSPKTTAAATHAQDGNSVDKAAVAAAKAQAQQTHAQAIPAFPSASLLASRERAPKAIGPVPHHAFIPVLPHSSSSPSASTTASFPSSHQQQPPTPQSATSLGGTGRRRNTLPPPTDGQGHLLVYGKTIPFPESYLNHSVPGMNAPERRRIFPVVASHGGASTGATSGVLGAVAGHAAPSMMSISAPSSGLIHPTVERSKAYAAKANALFAIETGLDVWVRAMGATRPGVRNAYNGGGRSAAHAHGHGHGVPHVQQHSSAPRRASALGGMSPGGPVSAAAAAYKQGFAQLNLSSGTGHRQLASGRTQSISAHPGSPAMPHVNQYAQFGGASGGGGQHPNRREEPSVSTIRSDLTFPMRGDGGRAKDMTPFGHGANMGSIDSSDSRRGDDDDDEPESAGLAGSGAKASQRSRPAGAPDSPPNAPPRNLPYPGVLALQGRTNSALSVEPAPISARSAPVGPSTVVTPTTDIPPRGSSIDLLGEKTASSGGSVMPPNRRTSLLGGGGALAALAAVGQQPAHVFEPTSSHGPRMPRTATGRTVGGRADTGGHNGTAHQREHEHDVDGLGQSLPPSSGASTPRDRGGISATASVGGNGPPTRLELDPLDPLGLAIGGTITATAMGRQQSSGARSGGTGGSSRGRSGSAAGWTDVVNGAPEVATPGSVTSYMTATSSSAVGTSGSVGGRGSPAAPSSARHNKVVGPRAPKLSLTGVSAFDGTASFMNGGAPGGAAASLASTLYVDPKKRPSVSAAGSGSATSTSDRYGLGGYGTLSNSPQDSFSGGGASPYSAGSGPVPSPNTGVRPLPGAATSPLLATGGSNSPSVGHGLSSSPGRPPSLHNSRRPSAATGFIPVGVSSTVRKASFGGKEITHSRDFFFSDLGRGSGALGEADGFGEEPVVTTTTNASYTSPRTPSSASAGPAQSMLSPPGTPGMMFGTSPNSGGSGSGRSRTLSRSGSNVDVRGLGGSVDTLPGAAVPAIPRSPSLADTAAFRSAGGHGGSSFSYGSVRQNSTTGAYTGGGGGSSSGNRAASIKTSGGGGGSGSKKAMKKLIFEETLNKMQDVMPDADRDVLARYLEKAGGNDLAAMHNYFTDQAKGKIQTSRSPRRSGY